MKGNNSTILLIIAVAVIAVLGVMLYQKNQTPGEKIEAGINQAADGVGDAVKRATN